MVVCGKRRKLSSHVFNSKQKAKRVDWKWKEEINFQSLHQVIQGFIHKHSTTCPNSTTVRPCVQILSLWRSFLIQTTRFRSLSLQTSYNIMQNALSPGFKVSIIAVLICLPLFLPLSSLQSQSHMDNTDKLDCHLGMDLHFFELHLEMLFGFAF